MVVLDCVSKIYDMGANKVHALDRVSCRFEDGLMTAVCGKSGSGKSTLLHITGGLDCVSEGHIYINNVDITKLNGKALSAFRRQNIGFVFQFFNLVPELTVAENIRFAQQICKVQRNDSYFEELVCTMEIKDRLNHLPGQLSGGEKQRVAIARALISKPSLLLLDEPTGNLDTQSSEIVYDMLQILRKRFNQTIIVVTHDDELANKSDRIITLKNGKIVSGGQENV
ncbi:MAG TPA: ABC transporter ATP-binding protein [Oscillospiraceae bacterium]|nr:ABC transporter ATP-binding protein [Oscillospiraceae bacterium]